MKHSLLLVAVVLGGFALTGCHEEETYRGRSHGHGAYYGDGYGDPYYVNGGVQYYSSGDRYYYSRGSERIYVTELPRGGRYLRGNYGDDRIVERRGFRDSGSRVDRRRDYGTTQIELNRPDVRRRSVTVQQPDQIRVGVRTQSTTEAPAKKSGKGHDEKQHKKDDKSEKSDQ